MDTKLYKKTMEAVGGNLIQMGMNLIKEGQAVLAKTKYLTITVITRWCNDEMIAPFFLDHYSFADEIIVLLNKDTTDRSREIIANFPNTKIKEFEYTNGFNGREANAIINKTANECCSDWIIGVDADEFVFAKNFQDIRNVLAEADGNLVYADFWQIYRHRSEMDLDPTLKAVWLRRHGIPDRDCCGGRYKKPVVVRSGLGIRWGIGLHNYDANEQVKVSGVRLDGAHWRMADVSLAVSRRMRGRRNNVSKEDIENLWSCDNFDITEAEIRAECEMHLDDPQLF